MAAGAFVSADSDFEDNRVSGRVERVELAVVYGNENDMLVTAAPHGATRELVVSMHWQRETSRSVYERRIS